MNRITGVTFIIVRNSGEILMQLRDDNSKRYPNTWCFPGGTKESDEDELKTVIREIKEEYEMELNAESCKEVMTYNLSYGVGSKVFICMLNNSQNPVSHEGADMKWMKLSQIKKLKLGFEQNKIIPRLEKFMRVRK